MLRLPPLQINLNKFYTLQKVLLFLQKEGLGLGHQQNARDSVTSFWDFSRVFIMNSICPLDGGDLKNSLSWC